MRMKGGMMKTKKVRIFAGFIKTENVNLQQTANKIIQNNVKACWKQDCAKKADVN